MRVEHGTRQFLSEIDKLLVLYYHNIQLKKEVKVIHRRVKLVKGRAGKLQKKVAYILAMIHRNLVENITLIRILFC